MIKKIPPIIYHFITHKISPDRNGYPAASDAIFRGRREEYEWIAGKSFSKKNKKEILFHPQNRYKIKKYTFKKCTFFG